MSLDRKISRIKKISELAPDKNWENKTKYEILAEISGQNRLREAEKLTVNERLDLSMMNFFSHMVPSISKVIAGFLIIFMGTGLSFVAQASVPGEALWPIKRSIEKVQLSLTISSVKETEVHIKHVNERLEEIDKIIADSNKDPVKQDSIKNEKKQSAIKKAVTHLEQDVTAVDTALKVAQQEKKPLEVVELAKKVTDATKVAADILKQQSIDVDDKELSQVLDSAKEINAGVKKSAVTVALKVHEDIMTAEATTVTKAINNDLDLDTSTADTIGVVEKTTTGVDKTELEAVTNVIKEILASELDEALEEVQDLNSRVEVTNQEEISKLQIENTEAVSDEASIKEEISLEDIDSIKGNPQEGDKVLEEARALLADGFLKNAFYKISLVKEKYARADIIMEQIQEAIDNNHLIDAEIIDQVDIEILPEVIDETNPEETDIEASFTDEAIEEEPVTEEEEVEVVE